MSTVNDDTSDPAYDPGAFLDMPPESCDYTQSAVVVLPMPFEASVTYGGGTANGPRAIIAASRQIEYYSLITEAEAAFEYGIHTLPELPVFSRDADAVAVMDAVSAAVAQHAEKGMFVLGLGGEHSLSFAFARGLSMARGKFILVQIDAYMDLCDECEGNPFSHACGARRIAELPGCDAVLQLGIRSATADQVAYARAHGDRAGPRPYVRTWTAEAMHGDEGWRDDFAREVAGRRVILTFDVDGLDPAVVPATGTPEPDGLTWR